MKLRVKLPVDLKVSELREMLSEGALARFGSLAKRDGEVVEAQKGEERFFNKIGVILAGVNSYYPQDWFEGVDEDEEDFNIFMRNECPKPIGPYQVVHIKEEISRFFWLESRKKLRRKRVLSEEQQFQKFKRWWAKGANDFKGGRYPASRIKAIAYIAYLAGREEC